MAARMSINDPKEGNLKRTMILTGDVNLRNVTDPQKPFSLVAPTLHEADVVFGNLEGCLYDSEEDLPYKRGFYHAGSAPAPALQAGGFHALGCANNVTFGAEAIVSTLSRLDEMEIGHTGAGVDRASARTPAVLQQNGANFGFLQYTSVFWPIGHEATESSSGVAAVKAHTAYQPNARIAEMPGGPPTVITWPGSNYLKSFEDDIRALRSRVDVVVVSMHWGISGSDETAGYQVALGHAAIDAGADLVMGHGPHVIQGIEIYKAKPIFYSLGNFSFGWELMSSDWVGLIARIEMQDTNVVGVECSPVRPDDQGRTVIRSVQEEPSAMETLSRLSEQFDTELDLSGDRVVVWRGP